MKIEALLNEIDAEFFTGVPDSQLRTLSDFLSAKYGTDSANHIMAANEGNCVALAAGYHMATGKLPVVYMQNSGLGNAVNPVTSLTDAHVYGIPVLYFIGWRGEPGLHDEPQHVFMGQQTLKILEDLDIETFVIKKETEESEAFEVLKSWKENRFPAGKSAAFVVCKGALQSDVKEKYVNNYPCMREEILDRIISYSGKDLLVSTTGKTSRELFELREKYGQSHEYDFLTVGSMGHASSIALSLALNLPERRVWCIDGDGAALMHLGAMSIIGAKKPENLVHVVINNEAYESVGGMPTMISATDVCGIAKNCGYEKVITVSDLDALEEALKSLAEEKALCFLEIKAAIGSRDDLGRPTIAAKNNKENFMNSIKKEIG